MILSKMKRLMAYTSKSRYAKWNEQTPEQKRRKQMAQLNPEIVLRMIS